MTRHHLINGEQVPHTQAEEAAQDAIDAAWDASKPIRDWENLMRLSDVVDIPRWLEDHIESDHGGVSGNPELQAKYDAKKVKRSSKP